MKSLRKIEDRYIKRLEALGICEGKGGAPATPDYVGAANAQGAANVETARTQGRLNNPNFTNPYGSRQVTFNPDDSVNVVDSLTPAGQQQFDTQQRISTQLGDIAESGLGRVGEGFSKDFDTSNLANMNKSVNSDASVRDHVEQSLMERLNPQLDRTRAATETQLANQGIMRGSEAWNNSQDDLARAENDARLGVIANAGNEQTRQYGIDLSNANFGNQARQQGIQEESFLRNLPLNELNSLRTGTQVGVPTFQGYQGAGSIQAPNLMGATQAGYDASLGNYNANQAQKQGAVNTGVGLGLAALML